jgi:enoyl-CoA hydratase/carnithine racemase
LLCVEEPPIGWLLLDNPRRKNAISLSMWDGLLAGLKSLATNPAIRVVVLAGADGKNFCAGGDISEFNERLREMANAPAEGLELLRTIEKPTIAMIDGYCLGGGVALAASCDLRIAADDARVGIPAAKRGLTYDYGMMRAVVGLVGPARAKLIMYTARQFTAAEALRMGLVDEVAPAAALKGHVVALADEIAGNAPLSISASKFIIDMVMREESKRDMAACQERVMACANSDDYREATRSFMEKRAPIFTGS